MEQYIVSARKYRPTTFDSVVGQQALVGTLKQAIIGNKLAHAYLFCGSRGVGKTSCARIFAKTINCQNRTASGEACNECDSCRQFNENRSMNIIEMDAASHNGVDSMKDLIDQVQVPPTIGKYRVFIIDEVHMLTSQAFNAFLKTLEEPPSYVVFILATTEKHKIIPTILSRCQIYDFNRISINDMVEHMAKVAKNEGITAEKEALALIANKADGAMRDALSIFDQVAASSGGNITYQSALDNLNVLDHSYYSRLIDAFVKQDVAEALLIYKDVRNQGFDSQFFINGLGLYLRDLAMATNPATASLIEAGEKVRQEMQARAASLHPTWLYRAMELCNDADFNFRQATNKQFLIELTLIRLCQLFSPSSVDSGSDGGQIKPLENYVRTETSFQAPQQQPVAPAPQPKPQAPQAPQAPQLKAQPAPAPHSAAIAAGRMSLGAMMRSTVQASHPADARTDNAKASHLAEPFTSADVQRVWVEMKDWKEAPPLLRSVFALAPPVLEGEAKLVLTLPSNNHANIVANELDKITARFRRELKNDTVGIEIVVNETELPKSLWTDDQVLEELTKENPALETLINKYQLRRL